MRLIVTVLWIVIMSVRGYGQAFSEGSFAVGSQFGHAAFGLSSKMWFTPLIGVQVTYGKLSAKFADKHSVQTEYDSENTFTAWDIGGRVLLKVLQEKHMRAYVGVGYAKYSLKYEEKESNPDYEDYEEELNGFGLEAIAGAEWSFDEIPHLAFFSEIGVSRIKFTDEENDRNYYTYDPNTGEYTEGTETVKYEYTFDGVPSLFTKAGVFFYF